MEYIFILIFLFTLLFMILYFIYFYIVIGYIKQNYSSKKLSIYWIQYLITCLSGVFFLIIYLCYLLKFNNDKQERDLLFEDTPIFIIILSILLVAFTYIIISNIIFDSIASFKLSFNLNKMIKINSIDFQALYIKITHITTNIFNSKQYILYWVASGIVSIILVTIFELEYLHYDDRDTVDILKVELFITFLIKCVFWISFITLLLSAFIMNYFRKKFFMKNYYNEDKFGMKLYNIKSCQIIYNSDIIIFKIICDFIISLPVLIFLIFKICNGIFFIISEGLLYLYIFILGALYLKIDKNNNIGEISETIEFWFQLKSFNFHFGLHDHMSSINENTYKYSKQEKECLKTLKLDEIEGIYDDDKMNEEKKNLIGSDDVEINIADDTTNSNKLKTKSKKLNFETDSELYVLYKLLMLYFNTNESLYLRVQKEIIKDDGMPFKRFITEQNNTKNKKNKGRLTFGASELQERKNNFVSKVDRISRISRLNSSNIYASMKFKEKEIFISLEEKELREEFKKKYDYSGKEENFKIESLSSNGFFELFPFYQISIQDIQKSLNPSDNKKIYKVIRERNANNKKKTKENKNNIESESENNLFYTFNSLLMMEVYEPEEFISFNDLNKFTLSYGTYLTDIIKNINYTFIPLILGVFSVEICGENKVIILYRNPLFFNNFYSFNHWINFYITEGPEKLKVSLLQNEIIDINEIEIKNSLKMNEADYEEIINNLKRDFDFFMKLKIQVYPIIHLFIGDDNDNNISYNNDANESSLIGDMSSLQNNISDIINVFDDVGSNSNNNNKKKSNVQYGEDLYVTERNSLMDKEYYSSIKNNNHTIKIYFTHFFRLDCELNKQNEKNEKNDNLILESNHYCQYLEGQLQTYLTKTSLFEMDDE